MNVIIMNPAIQYPNTFRFVDDGSSFFPQTPPRFWAIFWKKMPNVVLKEEMTTHTFGGHGSGM